MKKAILSIIALMSVAFAAKAQQNVYICRGYAYDVYSINATTDVKVTDDKQSVTVAGETYLMADIDSITFMEPQFEKIVVKYNGSTASVSIPAKYSDVKCTSGTSSHVVINSTTATNEYLYSLEGTSTDGSFTLNGSYKLTVELAGVSLTSTKGAAVDIECGKRIDIFLRQGTVNSFVDKANGMQKAAFYSKGHMEFKGSGTLNVTGKTKHALGAKEYIEFKGSLGKVNIISSVSDGIHCGKGENGDGENNYFRMNGGDVTISDCASDCIDSDDYGCIKIKGGNLTLNVNKEDGVGIKCDSIFQQTGGNVTINVSATNGEGIRASYSATFSGGVLTENITGKAGIGVRGKYAENKTKNCVLLGGDIKFSGTTVNMTMSGASYAGVPCMGILAEKNLYFSAGSVTLVKANSSAQYYLCNGEGDVYETSGVLIKK